MNTLYGDLPAVQSNDSGGDALVTEGWARKPTAFVPTSVVQRSNQNKNSSALLFKPRQTSASKPLKYSAPSSATTTSVSSSSSSSTSSSSSSSTSSSSHHHDISSSTSSLLPSSHDDTVRQMDPEAYLKADINDQTLITFDVEDPYDPSKPNDYLQLCAERKEMRRINQLVEENQIILEEQQRLREMKERERASAIERGDIQKLQEIGGGVGRGRGRGNISNLPAWMTAKTPLTESESIHSIDIASGQFDNDSDDEGRSKKRMLLSDGNNPTLVVLLRNIVAIGNVDDQLADEVRYECEEKYGRVDAVLVHEIFRANEVRTFVKFQSQRSADDCVRGMHNRYFGGRQIQASFYQEDLFERRKFEYGIQS